MIHAWERPFWALHGGEQKNGTNQKKQTTSEPGRPFPSHKYDDRFCHNYTFASLTLALREVNSQSIVLISKMIFKMKYYLLSAFVLFLSFVTVTTKFPEVTGKRNGFIFGEYVVGPLAALLFWPIPGIEMPSWLRGYWVEPLLHPAYAFRQHSTLQACTGRTWQI